MVMRGRFTKKQELLRITPHCTADDTFVIYNGIITLELKLNELILFKLERTGPTAHSMYTCPTT